MKVFPEYYQTNRQGLDLSEEELTLARGIGTSRRYGYLFLSRNQLLPKESWEETAPHAHVLVHGAGILVLLFQTRWGRVRKGELYRYEMEEKAQTKARIQEVVQRVREVVTVGGGELPLLYPGEAETGDGTPRLQVVPVFPNLPGRELPEGKAQDVLCADDLQAVDAWLSRLLGPELPREERRVTGELLERITGQLAFEWFARVREAESDQGGIAPGADSRELMVKPSDTAVESLKTRRKGDGLFEWDAYQCEKINSVLKGDIRLVGCAGSGKTALLLAKCYKAAQANPKKNFLFTCFNRNLAEYYRELIIRRGVHMDQTKNNVDVMNFDSLCWRLLNDAGLLEEAERPKSILQELEEKLEASKDNGAKRRRDAVIRYVREGKIKPRYYGVFIDEVQQFEPEWCRCCYDLLKKCGPDRNDYIFVICGDMAQTIEPLKKDEARKWGERQGQDGMASDVRSYRALLAPWQDLGQNYPDFRDGVIRLDRNYRNCLEVNRFVTGFMELAKEEMELADMHPDPDAYALGRSERSGMGVFLRALESHQRNNEGEAQEVFRCVEELIAKGVPESQIAVVFYRKSWPYLPNPPKRGGCAFWGNAKYEILGGVKQKLMEAHIDSWSSYDAEGSGRRNGVALLSCEAALGLDFQAVILCGLLPMGLPGSTRNGNWRKQDDNWKKTPNKRGWEAPIPEAWSCIHQLYIACTRARDALYIVLPEDGKSFYMGILLEAKEAMDREDRTGEKRGD